VAEVVNHVVFADPLNTAARELQADALEQLGFQAESGPWRNFYLSGAADLRRPRPDGPTGSGLGPQAGPMLAAMTVEMVFDLLGVRVDGPRADGTDLAIGWRFTDLDEEWTLRLEHGAVNAWPVLDSDVATVIALPRPLLTRRLADPTAVGDALESGELTIEGDGSVLGTFLGLLDRAVPGFNIVEP
jgi:alkyl sulfatase BDS1-like metallo-beta-lactamase superfamily hydrolase